MTTFQAEMTPRFQQLLERREAELRALLAEESARDQAEAQAREPGEAVTDFKDLADAETSTAVHEMQHTHAVQELEAVQAALLRLARGQYGLCLACGEPIELRRLEALPTALRCIRCQSLAEAG